MSVDDEFRRRIRSDVPHSARVWNAWLGGKDHYPVDRELAEAVSAAYPQMVDIARASRAFQIRAVRHLASAGVRQFLDVGTGLPVANSTHEVAQSIAPESRIVYVDNDPIVLAHAEALLTSASEGSTAYVEADLSDVDAVVDEAARTLDLSEPVAVLLLSTLGHLAPADGIDVVRRYLDRMPSGSYLVLCDTVKTPQTLAAQEAYASGDNPPYLVREPEEITGCAEGLELVEPGFVPIDRWRPEEDDAVPVDQWGLVARKP
ncbi:MULTISPECIES: SAM-dependent methyltransferase [Streptomyces]|uniref:S-adenosyl methyltransferase n=1 Tax=Streptomyces violaceoruber TaxID=1935 RepID=A0A1V0U593_STRVN|nr:MULTISPECIES: SAM-dependent methyltransferase [Streptomyces]MYW80257.1 SAM-dependent methyltransferase [Streptomyces sp. SID8369]NEA10232.1 SAM-dependent methyltransferase [Streptomyces sp. SID10692]NEC41364.1 SAM-dependent methyltransferase [Streptomyces sp. SID8016]ARF60250.1 S-adenosyl methyltransferase [Streptomyces violaceoruber]KOG82539.1 S-adenosyl methyltransferase [Streptomyces griseus subsp. rhodochrous]